MRNRANFIRIYLGIFSIFFTLSTELRAEQLPSIRRHQPNICLKMWLEFTKTNERSKLRQPTTEPKNIQLYAWLAQDIGDVKKADEIEKAIAKSLLEQPIQEQQLLNEGSNGAILVTLQNGVQAVIKKGNLLRDPQAIFEQLAYNFSKIFNLKIKVPVSVSRTINHRRYSMQVFVPNKKGINIVATPEEETHFLFLDFLLDNTDRHSKNKLLSETNKMVAIDHGSIFKNTRYRIGRPWVSNPNSVFLIRKCADKSLRRRISEDCVRNILSLIIRDRALIEVLRNTPEEIFREQLRNLSEINIRAFFWRRQLILDFVDGKALDL